MKKFIFSFILILLCLLSVKVCAEGKIFEYSFLSQEEESAWSGIYFDRSLPSGKGYSAFINSPFGEVKGGSVSHVIDFSDKIHLEAGKFYTLSGLVLNPLNEGNHQTYSDARLENGANTVIVTVSGSNTDWQPFSVTFYSGQSGDFNLSVHFTDGNEDFGFFIDEIMLREDHYTLSKLGVRGTEEIMIPINTVSQTRFIPYLISSEQKEIVILSDSSVVSSCTASSGTEYDNTNFTLSVSREAVPDTVLTVDFTLKNYADLAPTSLNVTLTDNMINDSTFDGEGLNWTSSSNIEAIKTDAESYISLPTNDYGKYGYFSTLTYNESQLLIGGELYVLRAKVKSDIGTSEREIYAKNTATLNDSSLYFEIKDVSGTEWKEVFAAFIPEASGVYDINVNLCSAYDSTVFVDDISLSAESLKPEHITLHAPGNIAVPDVITAYPVSALLRDQLGNVIEGRVNISLISDNTSLQFDPSGGYLTVFPDTLQGEYILRAEFADNPEIYAELPFTVSFDYIGDGTFEKTAPNEWWTIASPFEFSFYLRNDGYSRRALVNSDGPYFILLNNSYVHLLKDTPYVFSSEFSSATDCTVTLFVEDLEAIVHPLAQFYVAAGTTLGEKLSPELFLAEENVVGRIFLYIQSDYSDSFSIYCDNLSLKKATVLASNLHATGTFHVSGTAEAHFSFYNSVTQDSDASSSIVNWYVSSEPNENFAMLENFDRNIYFDTSFLNKYVYFEVIPVCPVTGFSGYSVRSEVYRITSEELSEEPGGNSDTFPTLTQYSGENLFEDINDHWAEDCINELKHNKIINGRTETEFCPNEYMTRAEFAKLIASAFSIRSITDFSQFNDISKSDWFYNDVCALNQNGIINGISADSFAPHSNITREDAVVIVMRIYERFFEKPQTSDIFFNDNGDISDYAKPHIQFACELDIVKGNDKNCFLPKSNITRAEASALVYRLIKEG